MTIESSVRPLPVGRLIEQRLTAKEQRFRTDPYGKPEILNFVPKAANVRGGSIDFRQPVQSR